MKGEQDRLKELEREQKAENSSSRKDDGTGCDGEAVRNSEQALRDGYKKKFGQRQ